MTVDNLSVATEPTAFQLKMKRLVDSLRHLERLGCKTSLTIKKLKESAAELSAIICGCVPASLRNRPIRSYRGIGKKLHLGDVPDDELGLPFPYYEVADSLRKSNAKVDDLADRDEDLAEYVQELEDHYETELIVLVPYTKQWMSVNDTRDGALLFARDVNDGLLDVFNLYIETGLESSLEILTSAAKELRKALVQIPKACHTSVVTDRFD